MGTSTHNKSAEDTFKLNNRPQTVKEREKNISLMSCFLAANQYHQIISSFYDLLYGNHTSEMFFINFVVAAYREKLVVALLSTIAKVTASNSDGDPLFQLKEWEKIVRKLFENFDKDEISWKTAILAQEITDNYSQLSLKAPDLRLLLRREEALVLENILTLVLQNIVLLPDTIARLIKKIPIPNSLQKVGSAIAHELTMSTNEYIARALSQGRCANNLAMHLDSLTNAEAKLFIEALKSGNAPPGLTIDYDKNSIQGTLHVEIQELLKRNELRHAALACVTIQQGKRDDHSICSTLPQEILENIYTQSFPASASKKKLKTFLNHVSSNNPYCLFKLKEDHKSELTTPLESNNETRINHAKR